MNSETVFLFCMKWFLSEVMICHMSLKNKSAGSGPTALRDVGDRRDQGWSLRNVYVEGQIAL